MRIRSIVERPDSGVEPPIVSKLFTLSRVAINFCLTLADKLPLNFSSINTNLLFRSSLLVPFGRPGIISSDFCNVIFSLVMLFNSKFVLRLSSWSCIILVS